jgi:hypothetical protein
VHESLLRSKSSASDLTKIPIAGSA